jgi:hypothetical protein
MDPDGQEMTRITAARVGNRHRVDLGSDNGSQASEIARTARAASGRMVSEAAQSRSPTDPDGHRVLP